MSWTKTQKRALVSCLLACGLMVVASFLPWLSLPGGGHLSGWDLYTSQRDSGGDRLVIWHFFANPNTGKTTPFFTGLATIIGALVIAVSSYVMFLVYGRARPRPPVKLFDVKAARPRLLHVLLVVPGTILGIENLYFYVDGGRAVGASLGYGMLLAWVAAGLATVASFLVDPTRQLRLLRAAARAQEETAPPEPELEAVAAAPVAAPPKAEAPPAAESPTPEPRAPEPRTPEPRAPEPLVVLAAAPTRASAWLPDPTERHEWRYWDGAKWTDHVADADERSTDPFAPVPKRERTLTGSR